MAKPCLAEEPGRPEGVPAESKHPYTRHQVLICGEGWVKVGILRLRERLRAHSAQNDKTEIIGNTR